MKFPKLFALLGATLGITQAATSADANLTETQAALINSALEDRDAALASAAELQAKLTAAETAAQASAEALTKANESIATLSEQVAKLGAEDGTKPTPVPGAQNGKPEAGAPDMKEFLCEVDAEAARIGSSWL